MPNFQSSHYPPEGGTRSLTETLLLSTTAANTRTEEANLMFGGVASAIDDATREASTMPQHLITTYQEFLERLQSVAQEFFESHVRGNPVSSQPKKNERVAPRANHSALFQKPPPVPKTTRPQSRPSSYANAASRAKGTTAQSTAPKPSKPQ
ncbi:hypothetical protein K3495_g9438, partial [Podosphaera aphanis]